jgi:hypothetical protein
MRKRRWQKDLAIWTSVRVLKSHAFRQLSHSAELASPDVLWSILTPEERKKFLKAVDNPSSELAQQLLSSEELENDSTGPWWEAQAINDATPVKSKRFGPPPVVMTVPPTMTRPLAKGPTLIYNVLSIWSVSQFLELLAFV